MDRWPHDNWRLRRHGNIIGDAREWVFDGGLEVYRLGVDVKVRQVQRAGGVVKVNVGGIIICMRVIVDG